MIVRIKKLNPLAQIPKYAHRSDAAVDLVATSVEYNYQKNYYEYGTGISVQLPENTVGLLLPRSSISNKDLVLCNSIGVIDESYTGELKLRFKLLGDRDYLKDVYEVGERIGQLMIIPRPVIYFEEVTELKVTDRGSGGFGSTNEA